MQPLRDRADVDPVPRRRTRPPTPAVLHADDWILVADKPAGVLSIPGRGSAPTLVELLYRSDPALRPHELRVVHRLDRGASGVIVLARSEEAQRRMTRLFVSRAVKKTYLALVSGWVSGNGEVDAPLFIDRDKRRVRVDPRRGKPSHTSFRVLERLPGHTLLECQPRTGRLHQIRVHLWSVGHPLAVDQLYGGTLSLLLSAYKTGYRPNRHGVERPLIRRLTLHALQIAFPHPATGETVTFEAPLPKDFRAALTQLRRLRAVDPGGTPP